jgi:hypothetical protein
MINTQKQTMVGEPYSLGLDGVTAVNLAANDKLSKLGKSELAELFTQLSSSPLRMRQKLGLPAGTTYGMELEFEDANYDDVKKALKKTAPRGWSIYQDTTVCSKGFNDEVIGGEITTPPLRDTEKAYRDLAAVCKMLKEHSATTGDNCAGHIHIGSQVLGDDYHSLYNFLKTWCAFEPVIYRFSYGDKNRARAGINSFAMPLSPDLAPKLSKIAGLNCLKHMKAHSGAVRDRGMSLDYYHCDGRKKDTIEIRCPNGTLNPVIWQNNLNTFAKLVGHCKNKDFDSDVVDYKLRHLDYSENFAKAADKFNLQDALDFSDMIFGNNLDKLYFLKQYAQTFANPDPQEYYNAVNK